MASRSDRFARPLMEHGVLRRRAVGLIVMGAGIIAMGFVAGDALAMTVGVIGVVAGGAWRLWLAIPDP
jgi:hypothetical protein